ncbi:dolichyl-phosphate beta-glucosyltransferase [Zhaonella formicivorans]|uniref:dolichyl-phosphate beta-glucosyltransferase n=1 Tax=Zhaonella formicivorans TaxID=2528593 RepID=UPI001D116524|nr:dolichyl-phosphate beta-glucosyltransferase [Zhaonella formicivorans]
MAEKGLFLSVIIPAYNEEKRLPGTLERIHQYLQKKGFAYEIIVVDDGSRDKTVWVAEEFKKKDSNLRIVKNPRNMGKGFTVRNGMLNGRGRYLLFTDSDLSTPIEEFDRFLPRFEQGYDIVIGSRALRDSVIKVSQPWYRVFMGKTFNLIVRTMFWTRIKDTQCGFKCFTREAARAVFPRQTVWGFGFDVEVLFIARKLGYKICEFPVEWSDSPDTKVNAIKDSAKMFWELLKIRLNLLRMR